jgi:uncharacterized DUF497 family protein
MKTLPRSIAFLWDRGNSGKSERKHRISDQEAEEPFFDKKKIIYRDTLHSIAEERFILLGKTKTKRLLYVVFTYRNVKIRIISARKTNKKEVGIYEKNIKNSKI